MGTCYTHHQAPQAQHHFELCKFRAAILVAYRTSSTEPGVFALLSGDTLVDEFMV